MRAEQPRHPLQRGRPPPGRPRPRRGSRPAHRDLAARNPAYLPDLATALNNLAIRLGEFGRRRDALLPAAEAVQIYRDLSKGNPTFMHDVATGLNNLAILLGELDRGPESLALIEEAVALYRQLAAQQPDVFQGDLARSLNNLSLHLIQPSNLSDTLQTWLLRLGDGANLDQAVNIGRQAARAVPLDHPDRAAMLSNLAGALQARFERSGDAADLDEAVSLGRQAARAVPLDHPDRAAMLSNLAGALQARFERSGDAADLDEAVSLGRRSWPSRRRAIPSAPLGSRQYLAPCKCGSSAAERRGRPR